MKSKIIDGLSFEISQPYAAGQTINEAEAKALNQVRSENIGNNLRTIAAHQNGSLTLQKLLAVDLQAAEATGPVLASIKSALAQPGVADKLRGDFFGRFVVQIVESGKIAPPAESRRPTR